MLNPSKKTEISFGLIFENIKNKLTLQKIIK